MRTALLVVLLSTSLAIAEEPKRFEGRTATDWTSELKDADVARRQKAVYALASLGSEAATSGEALAVALRDEDPYVRDVAARAMTKLMADGNLLWPAVPELLKAAEDPRPSVRKDAVGLLWRCQGPPPPQATTVVEPMRALTKDPDASVRAQAAAVLANLGPAAGPARPELEALLKDEEPEVRTWATLAMGSIGADASEAALLALLEDRSTQVRAAALTSLGALTKPGPAVVDRFVAALKDPEKNVRVAALGSLGQAGDLRALPAVAAALADDVPEVRLAATTAFQGFGPEAAAALPALVEATKDETAQVRMMVANAIAALVEPGEAGVAALRALLDDEEPSVRGNAAYGLGMLGVATPEVVAALAARVGDADPNVRMYAAQGLATLGSPAAAAVPALVAALDAREDELTRGGVVYALTQMGPAAREAAPALRRALAKSESVRLATALARVGATEEDVVRGVALLTVALYRPSSDASIAIFGLREVGPAARAAVPALRARVADLETADLSAAAALLRIGGDGAADGLAALRAALAGERAGIAAGALAFAGPAAEPLVPELVALASKDGPARSIAVQALGRVGPAARDAALPALRDARTSPDPALRRAAAIALRRIGEG